ncbi:MAG: alpha/beta fold hydrolase, partial [Isosphaeraceae bacterium]
MSSPPILDQKWRRQRITQAGSLLALLDQPDGRATLEAEADDPTLDDDDRLITRQQLNYLLAVRAQERKSGARLELFFSTDDVIIVPGFMGSRLSDVDGPNGLIWIDPSLVIQGGPLNALKLASYQKGVLDHDAAVGVRIEAPGPIPAIYDLMAADLELRRYSVAIHAFDWRKDIDHSAVILADQIRARLGRKPRPLHLIAHSQGSLVARRAIQILGAAQARRLVNNLVLLGPATFGTFSAVFALAGTHESLDMARKFGVKIPPNFERVMQSFTGLYQLLPWNPALSANGYNPKELNDKDFWKAGAEADRLKYGFGWTGQVDTTFFNDCTTIILGDRPTVGAAAYDKNGKLSPSGKLVPGDGTVPDTLAMLPGVRTYRVSGADHMSLPMNLSVMGSVRAILKHETPRLSFQEYNASRQAFDS